MGDIITCSSHTFTETNLDILAMIYAVIKYLYHRSWFLSLHIDTLW